jgi:hypothetical protein
MFLPQIYLRSPYQLDRYAALIYYHFGNLGLFNVLFDIITFSRAIDSFIVNFILQGLQQLPEVRLSNNVQI